MNCLALLLALSVASSPGEDLAGLSSDDAGVRELATRRLCGELAPEQCGVLLGLAEGADPELERRLTRIVAARDERLPLALELLASKDSRARAIGRAAFLELLQRWSPAFDDEPLPAHRARGLIREAQRGLIRVPRCVGAGVPLLERLAEGAEFGIPVVLDPELAGRGEGEWGPLVGTPIDQLDALCAREGWTYELRGPLAQESVVHSRLGHWLRVCERVDANGVPTAELLLAWAREVRRGGRRADAAARALATAGWSAPLSWFSASWRVGEDPAALSGLLAAAARGRVALVLSEPGTHLAARGRVDQLAERGAGGGRRQEIERIARGMAQAGALSLGGADPSEVWGEAAEEATPLGRWARLLVLEGHRRGDRAITRAVLAGGGSAGPELWRRALHAYIADLDRAPLVLSWEGLAPVLEAGHMDGLARLLHSAGVRPADLGEVAGVGLLRAELGLRGGEEASCAAAVYQAWRLPSRATSEVEALLARWCAEFGRVRVARALGEVELKEGAESRWTRLLELSGVLAPGAAGDPGEDLQRLAARAGGGDGAAVRGVLLEELATLEEGDGARVRELAQAWRRVGWALQETGGEDEFRSFAAQTRLVCQDPEVLLELLGGFPPAPRGVAQPLDMGLSRSQVPN